MRWLPLLLCIVVPAGCQRDEPYSAPAPTASAPTPAEAAIPLEDGLAVLGDVLPSDAEVLVTVDVPALVQQVVREGIGPLPAAANPDALRRDLGEQSVRLLGADLLKARTLVGFAMLSAQAVGVVLAGDWSGAKLPGQAQEVAGARAHPVQDLWIARIGGHLVLGNRAGVATIQSVASGALDSLAGTERLARHRRARQALGGDGPGTVASLDMAAIVRLGAPPLLEKAGLDLLAVGAWAPGQVLAAASVTPASREPVRELAAHALSRLRGRLKGAQAAAEASDRLEEALGGVLLSHLGGAVLDGVRIEEPEGWVMVRARTSALPIWLAGSLVPWAVRAYTEQQQRILTSEGATNVSRIAQAAADWYATEPTGPDGERDCALPAPVGPTPAGSPCEHPGDRYPVDAGTWDHPTWKRLGFRPGAPHLFRYTFETNGKAGEAARFTVRAEADLDCDGTWSRFERTGRAVGPCAIELSDEVARTRELE